MPLIFRSFRFFHRGDVRAAAPAVLSVRGVEILLVAALAAGPVAAPLAMSGAGAAFAAGAAEPAAPREAVVPTITVVQVTSRHLRDVVRASGLVEAEETVLVQPEIEGQAIENLRADVGDVVAAGAVLAQLSDRSLTLQKGQLVAAVAAARAAVAQAEAQIIEARSAADESRRVNDRTGALKDQGAVSQAQADQAQAAATAAGGRLLAATQGQAAAAALLTQAEAQLANVELQLRRTRVTAPVAGRIVARNATLGAIASAAGQPMFTLIRDDRLELRADVAEADVARLASGQPVTLRAVGGGAVTGRVRLVEPGIDTATRLGSVRISVDAPETAGLRAGMFAEAEIIVAERDALSLPVTAVADGVDGTSVMKVVDGVVSRVQVRTGIRDGSLVEVTEGVLERDLIVLRAGAFVRDGDRVRPVQPAPVTN